MRASKTEKRKNIEIAAVFFSLILFVCRHPVQDGGNSIHAFRQLSEAKQKTTRYAGGKQKG